MFICLWDIVTMLPGYLVIYMDCLVYIDSQNIEIYLLQYVHMNKLKSWRKFFVICTKHPRLM